MKKCSKCGMVKCVSEFSIDRRSKDGYRSDCKACIKEYNDANKEHIKEKNKEYYEANKDNIKEYREANKERIRERDKVYREANKEKRKKKNKEYREANKEYIKEKKKEYHEANKEKLLKKSKDYYEANKESIKEKRREYLEANKESINEYRKDYYKAKIKTDPLYKMGRNIRSNIYKSLRKNGYTKKSKTHEILGCSYDEFRNHIESQFGEGMSWENMGEWHLDHKIPVSYGEDEEEIKALNHYSNFQPLWGKDNLKKGNRRMD